MNFRKLKIFFETAKCLNMTKVAKSMYISQPSISQAIAELESDLDVKLFDRIGKRLYLTHDGEVYFEYSRRILNLYEEANSIIRSSKEGQKGKIIIGASTTIGIYILPKLIKEFNELHKNIEISLIIENTQLIEELIIENKVDIALVEGYVKSNELEVFDIGKDELVFISNPNNPIFLKDKITLKDLENENFIMRESGSGTREIIENYLIKQGCNYNVYMELGNTEAIVKVVETGLGIACVSCKAIEKRINDGLIKEIKIDDIKVNRDLYLIYHKDKLVVVTDDVYALLRKNKKQEYNEYFCFDEELVDIKSELDKLYYAELKELLYSSLNQLTLKQANRIYEVYFFNYTKTEIANIEGCSESAIRKSINRGLVQLKRKLRKYDLYNH